MKEITIVDTTLRDGEQAPGIAFTPRYKAELATLLSKAGVRELEVASTAMGEVEEEAVCEILSRNLPARIFTWNRLSADDVKQSLYWGVKNIFVSGPVSLGAIAGLIRLTPDEYIDRFRRLVQYATNKGAYVVCGLSDYNRRDTALLEKLVTAVERAGAARLRLSDTTGLMTPSLTSAAISEIKNFSDLPLEFHGHNDFGLATANSIAALEAGATHVDVTLLGLGERAGNAPLTEIVLAASKLLGYQTGIEIGEVVEIANLLAKKINYKIPSNRAVLGSEIFTHESGIHVSGVLNDPALFEPYQPELCGRRRKIVIGKHSGKSALINFFKMRGISLSGDYVCRLLNRLRRKATELGRDLRDFEIMELYYESMTPADNILKVELA